ncbi:hypothetical protein B0T22DRAFT_383000 [Podospora appendiculata]|uniref:Major facilitator superfamily (MFS) profile domain-containing protein n=1 Tax=Podospora appendiculata TaxID=314037 RepID=A0AAE1CB47_9PEZI|nr:hypothetical protein B0T22DRAFT_383000 [Podospora appendiculata]
MATEMAAGPLGAFMYRRFTWHSVFYLELAFSIIGLVVLYFSFANIRSHPKHAQSVLAKKGDSRLPRIDMEGWLLLVLAVCTPLIALTLGDNFLDWTHPIEMLLLASGPIFMVSFVLFELKAAKAPMFDMKPIFKIPYLRVLLQVFFVISIFNSVRHPPKACQERVCILRSHSAHCAARSSSSSRLISKLVPSTGRRSKTGP